MKASTRRDEKRWLQSTEKSAVWLTVDIERTFLLVDVNGTFYDQNVPPTWTTAFFLVDVDCRRCQHPNSSAFHHALVQSSI